MMEKMLTVKELAAILDVSPSWIYERTRGARKDKIPHVRLGKYIRFPEDIVRDFVEKHRHKGGQQ